MVSSGSMTHRGTLDGSTEGITCIEFDPTVSTAPEPGHKLLLHHTVTATVWCLWPLFQGSRVLAASYDKSALLWRVDDSVPKVIMANWVQTHYYTRHGWLILKSLFGPVQKPDSQFTRVRLVSNGSWTLETYEILCSAVCWNICGYCRCSLMVTHPSPPPYLSHLSHLSVSADSDRSQQEGNSSEVQQFISSGGDRKCGPNHPTVGPAKSRLWVLLITDPSLTADWLFRKVYWLMDLSLQVCR